MSLGKDAIFHQIRNFAPMEKGSSHSDQRGPSSEREKLHSWDALTVSLGKEVPGRRNQDSAFDAPDVGVFIVCDGMGGLSRGSLASSLATNSVEKHISMLKDPSFEAIPDAMLDVLTEANDAIRREARAGGDQMGSTAVLVKIKESRLFYVNLGDSRLYRRRNDGTVSCLTLDMSPFSVYMMGDECKDRLTFSETLALQGVFDTLMSPASADLIEGLSSAELQDRYGFSLEQSTVIAKLGKSLSMYAAIYFYHRDTVSGSLGSNEGLITKDVEEVLIEEGDEFMLVSDGARNLLSWEIEALWNGTYEASPDRDPLIIQAIEGITEPAKAIAYAARARSRDEKHPCRKPDDITVMMIRQKNV